MEDYETPEGDDYECRYADELEMLNDLEEPSGGSQQRLPGPRKTLVFPTPDKPEEKDEDIGSKNAFSRTVKRQIDEMYALLSDNDSEDEIIDQIYGNKPESQAKRPRMSVSPRETNAEEVRSTSQTTGRPSTEPVERDIPKPTLSKPKVFTRPPLHRDCVSLTGCDKGRRVYLLLNKEDYLKDKAKKGFVKRRPSNLLGVPFSVLKETIHEQRRFKLLEESRRITETLNNVVNDDLMVTGNGDANDEIRERDLWVDKYSPKTYVELLSDDGINRNLLSWLKLWDPIVFGKDKPNRKKSVEKQEKKKGKWFSKFNKDDDTDWMELDPTGRPVNKIALLCGPPGLGKTTLAHIVAQHAGYSVVEMNASDDRSVDVFRNKIESTTQMQSVLDSGKKPNCLIIDEIDGAPTPAINVLLSFIKKKDKETITSDQPINKKKRKKAEMLSRPIICICNDPYVPALRQLRQQAFVLTFPPTLSGRLVQRLYQVSHKELFPADMATLLALCEKAENDIRSCLNTLQFLRNKRQNLTVDFIQAANIGQKDTKKSLFSIWQSIFQLPRQKKKRFNLLQNMPGQQSVLPTSDPTNQKEITTNAARFYNILSLTSSNGQYSKLENGIFENYLNMKFRGSHLNLVVLATEWFQFADEVSQLLREQQHFVLMRYQPFLSVTFHMYFGAHSQPKIIYPSVGYENNVKQTKAVNVMSSMLHDVSPHLRGKLDTRTVAVQLMPYLLNIITPTLRPVNTQLYSDSEKKQISDLISTMISYNLTYHQERTMEGLYSYVLDPKVDELNIFPGLPQHKQLTYATKQFIAREIALEKMRRMEKVMLGRNISEKKPSNRNKPSNKNKPIKDDTSSAVVLELKPKEIKPCVEKQETDFFGRPIISKHNTNIDNSNQATNCTRTSQFPFWFKFQEGFSNAVRRTIKIQDLL